MLSLLPLYGCPCTFPAGFQYLTETYIAVQRIDKFLSMPEPPPPVHMRAKPAAAFAGDAAACAPPAGQRISSKADATGRLSTDLAECEAAARSTKGSGLMSRVMRKSSEQQRESTVLPAAEAAAAAADGVVLCGYPDGYVELGGADYDWNTNVEEMAAQVRHQGFDGLVW
jgi:hypothetical protein